MIKLENVSKFYKTESGVAVGIQKINLEFKLGEFVALTGESGSGKSTLLNVISGLDGYEDGEMYVNGEETSHYTVADWENFRSANVGFVFQNYNIIDSYTVLQNVMLALELQGYEKSQIKNRAMELIELVGLKNHKNHKASKLSGGEKQRCVIARALAKDCPIIMADEPTGNLDSKSGEQVLKLLHEVSKDKLVIVVTHNYDEVLPYATRKIKMHDGEVVEDKKLKKPEQNIASSSGKSVAMSVPKMLKFAFRNLFATPKKLVFSIIVQTIVMFLIVMVYTSQLQGIRNVRGFGAYGANFFTNQNEFRLVVQKHDGQDISVPEINNLSNLSGVKLAAPYVGSFYDFANIYIVRNGNNSPGYYYGRQYARPISASSFNNNTILSGNVPKNNMQLLISDSAGYAVSDQITLNFSSSYSGAFIEQTFEVSGLIKSEYSSTLIAFHEDYFKDKNYAWLGIAASTNMLMQISNEAGTYSHSDSAHYLIPTSALQGNQISFDVEYYNDINLTEILNNPITMTFWNAFSRENLVEENLSYVTLNNVLQYDEEQNPLQVQNSFGVKFSTGIAQYRNPYTFVSEELYNTLIEEFVKPNTISLIVEDYYSGTTVLSKLNKNTYQVYYNDAIEDISYSIQNIFLTIIMVVVVLIVGSFGYAIISWVLKNVMNSRKKDFAIFRSIGANEKTLRMLVILEQLIITLICFSITMLIMTIASYASYNIMLQLRHIVFGDYLLLFVVLLLLSMQLSAKFNKRIFKQTVIGTLGS